jgi:tetratricopeptide (TPR) repeat protein
VRLNKPDEKLSIYALWNAVSTSFVGESDLWWHQGDYDQCIRTQQTALYFDPEYVDLWTNIAWLQWSMGRHGEAIRTYRQCLAANPKSWQAAHALGEYYWRHGYKGAALTYLQQAADLGSPPVPRRFLGHAYRDLGEAAKAKQVWNDILAMDPNDPIARRELERAN